MMRDKNEYIADGMYVELCRDGLYHVCDEFSWPVSGTPISAGYKTHNEAAAAGQRIAEQRKKTDPRQKP